MQPQWKYLDTVGDRDPIAYGGGFMYVDELGNYCPELVWFEPASDDEWREKGNKTPVEVYRILIENDSEREWWYSYLAAVAAYVGQPVEELRQMAANSVIMEKALLYVFLISYFGPYQFDQEAVTITEQQAYHKYALEMKGHKEESACPRI